MPRFVLVISFLLGVPKKEDKTLIIQFADFVKREKKTLKSQTIFGNDLLVKEKRCYQEGLDARRKCNQ